MFDEISYLKLYQDSLQLEIKEKSIRIDMSM